MVRDGALTCRPGGHGQHSMGNNCAVGCNEFRLVVWKDGAHEQEAGYPGYKGIQLSTKAGFYYGGHVQIDGRCILDADNLPLCGRWGESGKFEQILLF